VGALPAHGQSHAMAQALIAADLHLALDVLRYFPAQVSLDL
jgi:hypothetical protein